MSPRAYHVTTGPVDFQFGTDAKHAVSRFPAEWSRTPWPEPPTPVDDKPALSEPGITTAIEGLADRIVEFRKCTTMDRLSAKLQAAAGVGGRVTADLEERADRVIAREEAISVRSERLFDAKHAVLDSADKGLDGIERHLALLSNDPTDPLERAGPSPSPPSSTPSTEVLP